MQTYEVDDELAALIERTAKTRPFERLSFNDALWRVVRQYIPGNDVIEDLSDELSRSEASRARPAAAGHNDRPIDLYELANRPLPSIIRDTFGKQLIAGPRASEPNADLEQLLAEAMANRIKKAASPSANLWASSVRSLKDKGFSDWKDICDFLKIDPAGDSARRSLQRWVKAHRPDWPPVPDP